MTRLTFSNNLIKIDLLVDEKVDIKLDARFLKFPISKMNLQLSSLKYSTSKVIIIKNTHLPS